MSSEATVSSVHGAPRIGDVIAGKYQIEGIVGSGGMGVVVCARHLKLGQAVAIKLLTIPDEERRAELAARFLHEAQAAAKLQGDHVVRIYDVGQLEDGLPFMVMELLAGSDLGQVLSLEGPLPEAVAVDYLLQACSAIGEAHREGIVHRDLKPANLFVTQRSDGLPLIKVLDFGISKTMAAHKLDPSELTLTSTRTVMGSPFYMSPEQVRDARRVDARTDVWALGVILQEMLTGEPAFRADSFPGVCAAIVADPPTPLRAKRPDVSFGVESVVKTCLEKDAQRRYQSAIELSAALAPFASRPVPGSQSSARLYHSRPRLVSSPALSTSQDGQFLADGATIASSPPSRGTLLSTPVSADEAGMTFLEGHAAPRRQAVLTVEPWGGATPTKLLGFGSKQLAIGAAALVLAGGLVTVGVTLQGKKASAEAAAVAPVMSTFELKIDSQPSGASVREGAIIVGSTPFSVTLSLAEGQSPRLFVLEKTGFEPFVLQQGAARGEVRVHAGLVPLAAAGANEAGPSDEPNKPGQHKPPAKPGARPSGDIRLRR